MPVFEGLFPEGHDAIIQSLLYRFALWHALAKLRMHSDTTLSVLGNTFKRLSAQLRMFRDVTCAAFSTVKLPKEQAARQRKAAREASRSDNADPVGGGRKVKQFNLHTYKFHAMGDYLRSIRLFGTIDSYTSQIVGESSTHSFSSQLISVQGELAHRALKAFYPLTNKINTSAQLAKHEHRRVTEAGSTRDQPPMDLPAGFNDHHYIPKLSRNNPLDIFRFLRDHEGDPAVAVGVTLLNFDLTHFDVQGFIPKLKDHVLYRLRNLEVSYCDHAFTDEERNSVIISDNVLYSVQTMQVCCTLYNLG